MGEAESFARVSGAAGIFDEASKHSLTPEDLPRIPISPRAGQRIFSFDSGDLSACLSTLERYSVQMLSEMKGLIDLLPKILIWHMQPQEPTDSDYVNLVKEMLEAYKEGLGLILIGFYNKRPDFLVQLYAKYGREIPPKTLKLAMPGAKDLIDHPELFQSIHGTFERCMSMSDTLITPTSIPQQQPQAGMRTTTNEGGDSIPRPTERKSLTPGSGFFNSLQSYRQATGMSADQGARLSKGAIKNARKSEQKDTRMSLAAAGTSGKKGKKGKKGKRRKSSVVPGEPYLEFETTKKIGEGQEYYDRFISCMQKCLLSVVDCLQVIETWTCLCLKHWVSVYDYLITKTSTDYRGV